MTQDSWRGDPWQPWTQHLYSYVGNNPVNLVDPTGHLPVAVLNGAAQLYSRSPNMSSWIPSAGILLGNGMGSMFTAFHEIAQVNIVKALGGNALLEVPIPGTRREIDVVSLSGEFWEVKPLGGVSAQDQKVAAIAAGATPGTSLTTISGIEVLPKIDLKMEITFPSPGEARYSFYKHDSDGNRVQVRTLEAVAKVAGAEVVLYAAAAAVVAASVLAPEVVLPAIPVFGARFAF